MIKLFIDNFIPYKTCTPVRLASVFLNFTDTVFYNRFSKLKQAVVISFYTCSILFTSPECSIVNCSTKTVLILFYVQEWSEGVCQV